MKVRKEWLGQALPATRWLSDYSPADARADVVAGLTVGVMLIPQGMAYAVIAGVPPIYGLYAALVPLLVYPLWASSRHLISGPVAIDLLVVAAGVGALAAAGTERYVALAVVLAGLVGLIQIAMGAARLGFIANLLSRPVIAGFTAAAALIIGFSQLGNLLGVELARSQHVYVLVREGLARVGEVQPASLGLGLASIVVLVLLPRWKPLVPEALVVVVLGEAVAWGLDLPARGVAVVGGIPAGLPGLEIPLVSASDLRGLLPTALTLALVQFMNVVSLGRVFAARHKGSIEPNRELVAVGAANVAGSLFRSLPVSGSFSRTAVSDQAGGRTPLANVVAALLVGLTLAFLTPLFYYLPMPVLAAIIIVAAVGLIDLTEVRALFEAKERDGYIALFTFVSTLVIGIQEGVLLGVGASIVAVLYRMSRPNVAELGHVPGTQLFRDLERFGQAVRIEDLLILRVDASFSFANAEYFKDFILESEREGRDIRAVVIDGTSINDLDTTAVNTLRSIIETLDERGITLYFTALIGPVREVVVRSGLYEELGPDRFYMGPHEAVVHVLKRWDEGDDGRRLEKYFEKTETVTEQSTPAAS